MSIKIKKGDVDEELVEYDDFVQMIVNGVIAPNNQIFDNMLTDCHWLAADNLAIFHKYSPKKFPYGDALVEKYFYEMKTDVSTDPAGFALLLRIILQNLHRGNIAAVICVLLGPEVI